VRSIDPEKTARLGTEKNPQLFMYEQIRDSKRSLRGLKKRGWKYKVLLATG
jgi:hypothetical protein